MFVMGLLSSHNIWSIYGNRSFMVSLLHVALVPLLVVMRLNGSHDIWSTCGKAYFRAFASVRLRRLFSRWSRWVITAVTTFGSAYGNHRFWFALVHVALVHLKVVMSQSGSHDIWCTYKNPTFVFALVHLMVMMSQKGSHDIWSTCGKSHLRACALSVYFRLFIRWSWWIMTAVTTFGAPTHISLSCLRLFTCACSFDYCDEYNDLKWSGWSVLDRPNLSWSKLIWLICFDPPNLCWSNMIWLICFGIGLIRADL